MYHKESLESLRAKLDLVEILSPYIPLQRAGSSYKACCPFHDEKTPSFIVQKGDSHYHCFGCGAHGDGIAFMMNYLKMSFKEAVEALAERFEVHLEKSEEETRKGPGKTLLKEALEKACQFFQFYLLYTEEGHAALQYLYDRGLSLDFIQTFRLGLSPKDSSLLHKLLHSLSVADEVMETVGLLSYSHQGKPRMFFSERITFPISDRMGAVIGFSARKYKEETFGGKYINTPETPLFKKSQTLYGLCYSRHKIAKTRKVIIVEGQIDALRLIHAGFDYTVAGQGTAFGEGHVKELLNLGIQHTYLALDGDEAGKEAAIKIGDLFQRKGIEVTVALLPPGSDPDTILRDEGPEVFQSFLDEGMDYLSFLFRRLSKDLNLSSPSMKNALVSKIAQQVRQWEEPLMVHESLRKLAEISKVPVDILGVGLSKGIAVQKAGTLDFAGIDPDKILETDLLRWLLLLGESTPRLVEIVRANLEEKHMRIPLCRRLFSLYLERPRDLISLMIDAEDENAQSFLEEIMARRVNVQKAEEAVIDIVKKILVRAWMQEREEIKTQIHSGTASDDELLILAKQFDDLKKSPPEVIL